MSRGLFLDNTAGQGYVDPNCWVVSKGGSAMAMPRVLVAVPFLLAGALAPAFADDDPTPAGTVGMAQSQFDRTSVTIKAGDVLRLMNNSNFLHVVGPGTKARISEAAGVPSFGTDDVRTMPRGKPYVTGPWQRPGTYHLTCTLHPEMNLQVVVT